MNSTYLIHYFIFRNPSDALLNFTETIEYQYFLKAVANISLHRILLLRVLER